ncbi:MAG: hypothetical protein KDB25_04600 [Leucobacter sp.]|nr:hypothetical protein [Leucobacter sp.]
MPVPLRRTIDPDPDIRPTSIGDPSRAFRVPSPAPLLVAVPPLPEPAPDPGDVIPDPEPGFIRALAVQGFQVVEGTRSLMQLGPLITVAAARSLAVQRASFGDRRAVYRDMRQQRPRATALRVDRPLETVAEAAVVLRTLDRSRAVALRLEWSHRHWRATELIVL